MSRVLCIVYVSEGLRKSVINQLRSTASTEGILAHSFVDATYGRTSFYLIEGNLVKRLLGLSREAFAAVDFSKHQGSHPALGTVDHVCFSPIGPETSMNDAKDVAIRFAEQISVEEQVPVYLYGELSAEKARLKEVRRQLGYFSFPSQSIPSSGAAATLDEAKASFMERLQKHVQESEISPSFGSRESFSASKGVMCVGVVPYVQNFNMKFRIADPKKAVMQVTKAVRGPTVC
jgi:glutamate formiminotransferase